MGLRARRRGRWHCNVEIKCKHALFSPFLVKRRDISPSERPQAPPPFSGKKPWQQTLNVWQSTANIVCVTVWSKHCMCDSMQQCMCDSLQQTLNVWQSGANIVCVTVCNIVYVTVSFKAVYKWQSYINSVHVTIGCKSLYMWQSAIHGVHVTVSNKQYTFNN